LSTQAPVVRVERVLLHEPQYATDEVSYAKRDIGFSIVDPLPTRTVFTVKPFPDLPITIATYKKAADLEPELSKVTKLNHSRHGVMRSLG
jgi:hypothetical protein